jgi:hypothetical protein
MHSLTWAAFLDELEKIAAGFLPMAGPARAMHQAVMNTGKKVLTGTESALAHSGGAITPHVSGKTPEELAGWMLKHEKGFGQAAQSAAGSGLSTKGLANMATHGNVPTNAAGRVLAPPSADVVEKMKQQVQRVGALSKNTSARSAQAEAQAAQQAQQLAAVRKTNHLRTSVGESYPSISGIYPKGTFNTTGLRPVAAAAG